MTIHHDIIRDLREKQSDEQQHINRYKCHLTEGLEPGFERWLRRQIELHQNEYVMYEHLIQEQLGGLGEKLCMVA